MEDRGYMAAGYAYGREDAVPRYYKDSVLGRDLDLRRIPTHARSVVMHTRLATHGDVSDNRNNHPVLSPDKTIALAHNGVIWNHDDVRKQLPYELPDVDSAVLPALIQDQGVSGLRKVSGDAAMLWLDAQTGNVIHAARQEHSPLCLAVLEDGSMAGASTWQILSNALDTMRLQAVSMDFLEELQYVQILNGEIVLDQALERNVGFHYGFAASTRGATSGGTGFVSTGSSFYDDWPVEDDDIPDDFTDDLWGREIHDRGDTQANFYTTDYYGNELVFNEFSQLCLTLAWYSGLHYADPFWENVDDDVKWIEHFSDIGELTKDGHELSWINFPDMLNGIENKPSWIHEGIGYLRQLERASA